MKNTTSRGRVSQAHNASTQAKVSQIHKAVASKALKVLVFSAFALNFAAAVELNTICTGGGLVI